MGYDSEMYLMIGRMEGKIDSLHDVADRFNQDIIDIRDCIFENQRTIALLTEEVKTLNNVDTKLVEFSNKWGLNRFTPEEFIRGMRRLRVLSNSRKSKSILARLLDKQTRNGYIKIISYTLLLAVTATVVALTEYIQTLM